MPSPRTAPAIVAALLAAAPLRAQQPDSARVPLPAITVDALRSGVDLARAPLGRTLLGAGLAAGGAGVSLEESLRTVPGLQVDNRHNQALGERLSSRGFGARAGFGVRGVRVLVDGIPATMPDGQTTMNHVDPAHIAEAEVVRGPGAAFLGNAAGGAVLLRTGAGRGARASLLGGAAGLRRVDMAIAGAAGGGYAAWQRADGFREWSAWERVLFGGTGAVPVGSGRLELAAHAVRYDAKNPGALTREQLAADPAQASASNVRQQTGEEGRHAQLGIGWVAPLGRSRLEVRAHGGVRSLDNPIPPRIIDLERGFGGVRAQLARSGASYALAAGAELEAQSDDRRNYANESGERGALALDQHESVRGTGAFAHGEWAPSPWLLLFGAVRADRYRFAATDRLASDGDDSGERALGATTGTLGVTLTPVPGLQLFANAGTAYETPTTTELANAPAGTGGFNPELEPERTRSAEVGVRLAAARVDAELTLFRAEVRDKLIPFEVETLPGRQFYRNAGRARHQGLELAVETSPHRALVVRGAYTRLDARFRDYGADGVQYAGLRVPGAAAHQLALAALVSPGSAFRVRADLRRTGRVAVNDANDGFAPAYTLVDARIAHEGVRVGRVRLGGYAGLDNVLDRKHAAAVSVNAFGGRYFEPGPGRSLYLGLRVGTR